MVTRVEHRLCQPSGDFDIGHDRVGCYAVHSGGLHGGFLVGIGLVDDQCRSDLTVEAGYAGHRGAHAEFFQHPVSGSFDGCSSNDGGYRHDALTISS